MKKILSFLVGCGCLPIASVSANPVDPIDPIDPTPDKTPIFQPIESKSTANLFAQGSSEVVGDTFDAEAVRKELLIDPLTLEKTEFPPVPGSTLGVPTGYGANWGNAYIGGAFTSSTRYQNEADGSLSLGMGFGDSRKAVGVEAALGIISLSDGFGDSGVFGFKVHRLLDEKGYFSAAVGWENMIKWGDAGEPRSSSIFGSNKDTFYGVVTGRFDLQPESEGFKYPLTASIGVGSGRFRSKGALDADQQTANVFASVGLRVIPELSLITTWTGQELNMGTSIAPFRKIPIIINLGAADVTGVFPEGTRFIMTAGYAIQF